MCTKTKYETIVGLEVHVQLSTKTKAYCRDKNKYGESPNSCISPVTLGYPGTLPKINSEVIYRAIKLGIALNCKISKYNLYSRKNYFYPDLPKGYQITQDKTPICTGGYIEIPDKKINITRIHMEEDAGKSIHDIDPKNSLVDYNRAGVPLLEIVSEPEIRSPQEAYSYLKEIRKIVRYIGVSDGNMEEGSLRCDANISVRPYGSNVFRNRVEVKNINSFKNVMRAIELEVTRQIKCYENNIDVNQETRNYNASDNSTTVLRSKEDAHDYRYFTEPDIPPVVISQKTIDEIKATMPILPKQKFIFYTQKLKLSEYDSKILSNEKLFSEFFDKIIKHTKNYKSAANIMLGVVKSYLNKKSIQVNDLPISAINIAKLSDMLSEGKINKNVIENSIFPLMIKTMKSPHEIAVENKLFQTDDSCQIENLIDKTFKKFPQKVIDFNNGNSNLIGLFMGEIMRGSNGKLNPKKINEILIKKLKNEIK